MLGVWRYEIGHCLFEAAEKKGPEKMVAAFELLRSTLCDSTFCVLGWKYPFFAFFCSFLIFALTQFLYFAHSGCFESHLQNPERFWTWGDPALPPVEGGRRLRRTHFQDKCWGQKPFWCFCFALKKGGEPGGWGQPSPRSVLI